MPVGGVMPFLFIRKGSAGLWADKRSDLAVRQENLHACASLRVVFSAETLCLPQSPYLLIATKRNKHTPIFGRIKKMSLWKSVKYIPHLR